MRQENLLIKGIRTLVYFIVLLILMGVVCNVIIVEYVDSMKIRNILVQILQVVLFLLVIMLIKNPKLAAPRVTILDVLSIAILVVSIGWGFAHMWQEYSIISEVVDTFQGNNVYACYYAEGGFDNGYNDMENLLQDEIENSKKTANHSRLEEIYRKQVGEKVFVYFKEDEEKITEYDFFRQNDLYYCSGSNTLVYDGVVSSDSYTTEETIRKDIVNTMFRGVGRKEVGAPAWGVSADERISSMTINAEPVDDVILINEIDGKKYYFWIITNVGEIKTLDDVKAAEVMYE